MLGGCSKFIKRIPCIVGVFMQQIIQKSKKTGLLLGRKNIVRPNVYNLRIELQLQLLELQIMLQAIDALISKKIIVFDGLVGDRKCQTRASMIVDLIENSDYLLSGLCAERLELESLIIKINQVRSGFRFDDHVFIKNNIADFHYSCLFEFINQMQISFVPSYALKLIGLCLITGLTKDEIHQASLNQLSKQKIDTFVESAKIELCQMTVQYEQKLALKYSPIDAQQALMQIEYKEYASGSSCMTAFFPSWDAIFNKMKHEKQRFVQRLTIFCLCGGVQDKIDKLFECNKYGVKEVSMFKVSGKAVMIMETYQFQGSFAGLKLLLGIGESRATTIPVESQRACVCNDSTVPVNSQSIEQSIKAVFAQHDQFSNNATIRFGATINSKLKQEYDYFLVQPGHSINDMELGLIVHIYASTLDSVVQEQKSFVQNQARLPKNYKIKNSDIVAA